MPSTRFALCVELQPSLKGSPVPPVQFLMAGVRGGPPKGFARHCVCHTRAGCHRHQIQPRPSTERKRNREWNLVTTRAAPNGLVPAASRLGPLPY